MPYQRPPLPPRPQNIPEASNMEVNNSQMATIAPADILPNPTADPPGQGKGNERSGGGKKSRWSWIRRDRRDAKRKAVASGLMSAAEGLKAPSSDSTGNEDNVLSDPEAKNEEEEMTVLLEQLNLAGVNNRVFSISDESRELLRKFTQVLKDLVNGVPTAYHDLENLLTNSEDQLQRSYSHLPPWLQKLIEQLPSKVTQTPGAEMSAAASEKHIDMATSGAEKESLKMKIPNLKHLVMRQGAVVGMLKAIINFLKFRFPAFLVLLFVLWYCHKRGREVRLQKEHLLTEAESATLEDGVATTSSSPSAATGGPEETFIEEIEAHLLAATPAVDEGLPSTVTAMNRHQEPTNQSMQRELAGKEGR
ncbi:MAG: hypothetical protein Q9163_005856 [Psora crenata]